MKKRYTEEQIIKVLRQHENGAKVAELCRQLGVSSGTFYNWRWHAPSILDTFSCIHPCYGSLTDCNEGLL